MAEWCTPARAAIAVSVTEATPCSVASERAASSSDAARSCLLSGERARWKPVSDMRAS